MKLKLKACSKDPVYPRAKSYRTLDRVGMVALSDTMYAWGRLGGVTMERLGFIYVSNFSDAAWRITPDDKSRLLCTAL